MKTVTLCSSMTFYPEVLNIGETLESKGWKVEYPESSLIMKQRNNFNPKEFRKGITSRDKGKFIKGHFNKIIKSQAVLLVNKTKKWNPWLCRRKCHDGSRTRISQGN